MRSSSRVILNTSAQYVRTIINIFLTLYSTRLILDALGIDDYGLYVLIAGVISMLAFATNALSITTQRFLSFHQGKSELKKQRLYFLNSLVVHIIIGIIVLIGLLSITQLLFDGFLNIRSDRVEAAKTTYHIVSCIILITFLISPFKAVLISHENIVYVSIIEIIDGLLKVFAAVYLLSVKADKLVIYALLLGLIQLFNLLSLSIYSGIKYKECQGLSIRSIEISIIKDIISFAGWTIYSIGCIIGRTQGIAIVINKFFGATVNAAYGIGFQISGYVTVISDSILNALRPQIIKAEGQSQRSHMLWLSELASKFCTTLLCCIAIPSIILMPELLKIWLGNDVPEYATLFSRMIMLAAIFDTLTIGLATANQAIGNIKNYSIIINSIKIISVPVVLLLLKNGYNIISIAITYVSFEAICAVSRIYFIKVTGGLNAKRFIINVIVRLMLPLSFLIVSVYLSNLLQNLIWKIILSYILSNLVFLSAFYVFGINISERTIIKSLMYNIRCKLKAGVPK